MQPEHSVQLTALAERASETHEFFGAVLHVFQQQESLTRDALIRYLQTTPELFARLALCRSPASDSLDFIQEVRQISEFTQTDAGVLAAILRQVEALGALSTKGKVVQLRVSGKKGGHDAGLLAAARDREPRRRRRSRGKSPRSKET
jgi:hypothetical protein